MSKIDKTDIENIKLITKEAKLSNLSRIKIKKGDYEIELSSESSSVIAPVSEKIPASNKKTSEAVNGIICGFGENGYILAIDAIKNLIYSEIE